jgi:hypothetical protein
MQVLKIAVLVMFLFAVTAKAGAEQLAATLPSCAVCSIIFHRILVNTGLTDNMKLECMMSSITRTSCAATDQKCLCTDTKYTAALEQCVLASCTIREALSMIAQTARLLQSLPLRYNSYEKYHNIGLWSAGQRQNQARLLCRSRRWYSSSDRLHS